MGNVFSVKKLAAAALVAVAFVAANAPAAAGEPIRVGSKSGWEG